MWQEDREKENKARNQGLETSIKPFQPVREDVQDARQSRFGAREDMGKSKSVDKNRRGISRVSSAHRTDTKKQHPSEPLLRNQPLLRTTGPTITNTAEVQQLSKKLEIKQAQLVILDEENHQLSLQLQQWKHKCTELYQCNQQLGGQLTELRQQIVFQEKCLQDAAQHIGLRDRQIEELIMQGEPGKLREQVQEQVHKIREMQGTIASLRKQLAAKGSINASPVLRLRDDPEVQSLQQQLKQVKQQLFEAAEGQRKTLFRCSTLHQHNQQLQRQLVTVAAALEQQQRRYSVLTEKQKQTEILLAALEEEVTMSRAMRRQMQECHGLRVLMEGKEAEIGRLRDRVGELLMAGQARAGLGSEGRVGDLEMRVERVTRELEEREKSAMQMSAEYEVLIEELRQEIRREQLGKIQAQERLKLVFEKAEAEKNTLIQKLQKQARQQTSQFNNQEIIGLKAEILGLQSKLRDADNRNQRLLAALQDNERENNLLKNHMELNRREVSSQGSDYSLRLITLNQQIEIRDKKLSLLAQENARLAQQSHNMQTKFTQRQARTTQMSQQITRLLESQQESKVLISTLKDKCREGKQLVQILNRQLESTQKRLVKTATDLQSKQLQAAQQAQTITLLRKQMSQICADLQQLKHTQSTIQSEQDKDRQARQNIYDQICQILGCEPSGHDQLQQLVQLARAARTAEQHRLHLEGELEARANPNNSCMKQLVLKESQRCRELEEILARMEQEHRARLVEVKLDYDVVYGKYMKYRGIVVRNNLGRENALG